LRVFVFFTRLTSIASISSLLQSFSHGVRARAFGQAWAGAR
jgi:hypothetical protein